MTQTAHPIPTTELLDAGNHDDLVAGCLEALPDHIAIKALLDWNPEALPTPNSTSAS